jgi:hypothetical protein
MSAQILSLGATPDKARHQDAVPFVNHHGNSRSLATFRDDSQRRERVESGTAELATT